MDLIQLLHPHPQFPHCAKHNQNIPNLPGSCCTPTRSWHSFRRPRVLGRIRSKWSCKPGTLLGRRCTTAWLMSSSQLQATKKKKKKNDNVQKKSSHELVGSSGWATPRVRRCVFSHAFGLKPTHFLNTTQFGSSRC